MPDFEKMAADLHACLDADDPDAALVDLIGGSLDVEPLASGDKPHPVVGLLAMLGARALLHCGMPERVEPLLEKISDALAPPFRQGEGIWRIVGPNYGLYGALIDAALALKDQGQAVRWLNECRQNLRSYGRAGPPDEPLAAALVAHPGMADYGPLRIEPGWLLKRYETALALGPVDNRLAALRAFHAGFLETALVSEAPQRAMPLIGEQLEGYLSSRAIDTSHFEFNAICVLAALGHFEEALDAARRLVRRGYHLAWRFNLEVAGTMAWTQAMRQNEWLAELASTPQYQRFLKEDVPRGLLDADPAENPLCVVKDGEWSGKKPKRCRISREMIQPGEKVVRYRQLFLRPSDGGLEIAARKAFSSGPWKTAREQFENDAIPLRLLFPRRKTVDAKLDDAPYIHEFAYDVARNPEAFDIARAALLIADHAQPPIAYTWEKGSRTDRWAPAFPPFAGADGHGDAVNLVWRIVKAGFCEALVEEVRRLPEPKADKVFAMLATFDDARLRTPAADHFGLDGLSDIMETVFKNRLTLEDHETLAAFGHHARYRAAIVAAMQAYGLHLYSNYRPKADWFLAGLERYTRAGGSPLLYFLIDHPQDDPVLQTVIEKGWVPDTAVGSSDEYRNARPFYIRATLFHLARHRPERLGEWLKPERAAIWTSMAYDRETLRLIRKYKPRIQ